MLSVLLGHFHRLAFIYFTEPVLESLGIAPLFHFWGVISVKIPNCQNPESQFVQT